MSKPLLQIIIGSTRPGRVGPAIAHWFTERARAAGGFQVELVDLAEAGLPLLDEPNHPRLQQYEQEHTKAWSRLVSRADAYVFVVPEYNHSMNAATKNAIDFLYNEWKDKPVAFVSYGAAAGGLRAVQQLKQVALSVGMVPLGGSIGVSIPFFPRYLSKDGVFMPTEHMEHAADGTLEELSRVTPARRVLREILNG